MQICSQSKEDLLMLRNENRMMYIARVSPEYLHNELLTSPKFVSIAKYDDLGYKFIRPVDGEVGLMPSARTLSRFIVDRRYRGKPVELREYVWCGDPTPTELVKPEDYADYGITPLSKECLTEGSEEIGAKRTRVEIIHYILVPASIEVVPEKKGTPLKDTGNRTNLSGTGAERDINPENGRCDLLPASAINQYMSNTGLITRPQDSKRPSLVTAFHYIMQFMDWGDKQFLNEALTCIQTYHWYKDKTYSEGSPIKQDLIFAKAMMDLSVHYKNGALKYAERNWERGLPIHSFIDSAIRHLCKEMLGWDDEPHDIAVMWNLYGALWTLQHYPHLNDLPNYSDYRKEYSNEVKEEANSGGDTSENFVEEEGREESNLETAIRAKRKPHPETCFG